MKKIILSVLVLLALSANAHAVNRLLWTTDQQNIWTQLKNTNHQFWQHLKKQADTSNLYDDFGKRDALVYLITGDKAYAKSAWGHMSYFCGRTYNPSSLSASDWCGKRGLYGTPSEDALRARFIDMSIMFSWIADGLSAQDKANFRDVLDRWTDLALDIDVHGVCHGVRYTDTDNSATYYLGMVLYALAIRDEDLTRSNAILNYNQITGCSQKGKPVGGVDATGANYNSLRNYFKLMGQYSDGGEWMESSQYNINTAAQVAMGIHAINEYYGVNKFPEYDLDEFAQAFVQQMTPDMKSSFQWGDVQDPNSGLLLFRRVPSMSVFSGITKDPNALWVFQYIWDKNYPTNTHDYWHMLADPLSTQTKPSGITTHHANGRGIVYHHSGWNDNDSFFASMMANINYVDHDWLGLRNFNLYRNGGYAIDNPKLYYGNPSDESPWLNTVVANGGIEGVRESKGEAGTTIADNYVYHVGVTGGQWDNQGQYDGMPEFLHELTSEVFYYHHTDGSDSIFVFDRINSSDPKTTVPDWLFQSRLNRPNSAQYSGLRIQDLNSRHQWILHTPTNTINRSGDDFSWTAPNGETVNLKTYMDNYDYTLYSESSRKTTPLWLTFSGSSNVPNEQKYQIRLSPTKKTGHVSMLNVLHVGGNPTFTELTSGSGEAAHGAMIEVGTDNIIVMFSNVDATNRLPAPSGNGGSSSCPSCTNYALWRSERHAENKALRFFKSGFEFQVTTDGDAEVYIGDLDTTRSWSAQVNGSAVSGFSVDPNSGLGVINLTGAGTYNVNLSTSSVCQAGTDWRGCNTQLLCTNANYYWYNNVCNQTAQAVCDSENFQNCTNQDACEAESFYWYNDQCNEFAAEETCDSSHLSLCSDQSSCETATGYWYNDMCNATAAPSCDSNNLNLCTTEGACTGATGYWYSETCNATPMPGNSVVLSLEPSADVRISGTAPDTNQNGQGLRLISIGDAFSYATLMRFDLSSIPAGSVVTDVEFRWTSSGTLRWDNQHCVHELLRRDWTETGATWNSYKSGSSWTSAGVKGDGTDLDGDYTCSSNDYLAYYSSPTGSADQQINWDVQASFRTLVQNSVGDQIDLVIHQQLNDNDQHDFYDREHATASKRPKLIITYQPAEAPPESNNDPKVNFGNCDIKNWTVVDLTP